MKIVFENRGNGYIGKSMSVNASREYSSGNMPISKWTKDAIIDAFEQEYDYLNLNISKLTREEMIKNLLEKKSWHHTGAFYNETDFYGLKDLSNLTQSDIDEIIGSRTRTLKSDDEKNQDRANRELVKRTKDALRKYELVYLCGNLKYKTLSGLIKSVPLDRLNGLYETALESIRADDKKRILEWEKLPIDHWRHKFVDAYYFDFLNYVDMAYPPNVKQNSKEYEFVKNKIKMKEMGAV